MSKHYDIAIVGGGLAGAIRFQARYQEAETLLREAIRINTEVLGPDHPRVGVLTSNLGQALHAVPGGHQNLEADDQRDHEDLGKVAQTEDHQKDGK